MTYTNRTQAEKRPRTEGTDVIQEREAYLKFDHGKMRKPRDETCTIRNCPP